MNYTFSHDSYKTAIPESNIINHFLWFLVITHYKTYNFKYYNNLDFENRHYKYHYIDMAL